MHIPRWMVPRPAHDRRLDRVLRAARRDRYYRMLVSGTAVPSLDGFPFTDAEGWCKGRPLPGLPEVIAHPLKGEVLAAVPGPGRRQYTAIAGTAPLLLDRARGFARQRPQVEFAVLVVERLGDEELTEGERDQLWEAFQVPVYRLLLGFDGRLLGHECEALCGLHCGPRAIFEEHDGGVYLTSLTDVKHPTIRLRAGLAARLEHGPCDCGRPGVRLAPAWREQTEMSSAAD